MQLPAPRGPKAVLPKMVVAVIEADLLAAEGLADFLGGAVASVVAAEG